MNTKMSRVIQGNILDITEGMLVHQVNCQKVMGAGLAKQIAQKYPIVKEVYMSIVPQLGLVSTIWIHKQLHIVNLYGQDKFGTDRRYTDYDAHIEAWPRIKEIRHDRQIYAPLGIGCGLGGGYWPTIKEIAEKSCPDIIWVEKEK
jgi:O-acetyl-ADP-ribose deacetylase (regulator of RNase III)